MQRKKEFEQKTEFLVLSEIEKQETINERIIKVINKIGFIELPLIFDASNDYEFKNYYSVNHNSSDTLLFRYGIFDIVGFLPDTTYFYAFLYLEVRDMLYPTIVSMDKSWRKIDEKIICTMGCLISPLVDVTSCYDSVWVYEDLKIKSISKIVGTIELEDSISQVLNICNLRILDGYIDKNGKIIISESETFL